MRHDLAINTIPDYSVKRKASLFTCFLINIGNNFKYLRRPVCEIGKNVSGSNSAVDGAADLGNYE